MFMFDMTSEIWLDLYDPPLRVISRENDFGNDENANRACDEHGKSLC